MIAVVGSPTCVTEPTARAGEAGGLASGIALAAAAAGSEVQLIGRIGEDPAGDAVLLALARGGVGHIALIRDPGRATPASSLAGPDSDPADSESITALVASDVQADDAGGSVAATAGLPAPGIALEPADISLGLRYVQEFRVLVAADPLDAVSAAVVAEAATFTDATLIVIAQPGRALPDALAGALVLEAPATDPDGAFVGLVGRVAAAVDRGEDAGVAFGVAVAEGGWERASG